MKNKMNFPKRKRGGALGQLLKIFLLSFLVCGIAYGEEEVSDPIAWITESEIAETVSAEFGKDKGEILDYLDDLKSELEDEDLVIKLIANKFDIDREELDMFMKNMKAEFFMTYRDEQVRMLKLELKTLLERLIGVLQARLLELK